ncbi:hypothetical protein DFH07DRAFT_940770 [Mycena maculata]|uniref:DUF6532 domain-containing protein n=1 Tax=Mycena maculata TaxID=230809 RepID=A0AAD7NDF3_9AGAR|nr:hypothetical protein DFH07DRAFT_940770 [Mycena maculata]
MSVATSDVHKPSIKRPTKPTKLIAESESEVEATSSSDDGEDNNSDEGSEGDDCPVNAAEFFAEVISTRSKESSKQTTDASEDSESHEVDYVVTRKAMKKTSHPKLQKDIPEALFDSDEEYEVVAPVPKIKSTSKAKARQVDSDSEDSMPEAPARRRVIDSDIEMAETIADALVSIPAVSRSRSSSMGSGYSSGRNISVPASEIESNDTSEPEERPKKKKAKKISAARQRQVDSEKPSIQPSLVPTNASKGKAAAITTTSRLESSWDVSARLVLPQPNKDIGLTAQHPELQFVLRTTMGIIRNDVLFEESYPLMISRPGFTCPRLITAARIRPSSAHILERLLTDPEFGAILAPIPLDRMNILRGTIKRCAVSCVPAFFGLADMEPERIKSRIEELLKDHRYIFPTDKGQLLLTKPYRHGSIRFVLKEEIFSNPSFVTQNNDRFPATNAKHPERKELPDAMVALAATAVYAALLEYRMTGQRQTIPFTEDAYENVYRNHMASLADTRVKAGLAMHQLLHGLFKEVRRVASTSAVHAASGSSATLINLIDLPESD